MSREAELIKEIDEHIKEAGGLYGLELPGSDLQVIRAAFSFWVSRRSRRRSKLEDTETRRSVARLAKNRQRIITCQRINRAAASFAAKYWTGGASEYESETETRPFKG